LRMLSVRECASPGSAAGPQVLEPCSTADPHMFTRPGHAATTRVSFKVRARNVNSLIGGETIEQAGAARAHQILLAAAARRMRGVPRSVSAAGAIEVPELC